MHTARLRGDPIGSGVVRTVADLAEQYLCNWAKRKNTERVARENRRNLEKDVLPHIGHIDLDKIKRRDIHQVLQLVIERGAPIQSNRILTIIKKMFNYGIQAGLVEANPAHLIPKQPEREKDRVLSESGVTRGKVSRGTIGCLRMVLVTGQRPGEVLNMLHEEIDGRWWTIPVEKTKNKNVLHARAQRVYLSDLALQLIGSGSCRVFKSPAKGEALALALRRLLDSGKIKAAPFTPHDLRRTASTYIAEMGYRQELVDRLLGHVQGKISRTYNRYDYDAEKQQMMEAWGAKLATLIDC